MKRLAILGSTGSVGKQALEVVAAHPDLIEVEVLSSHSNATLLIEQAKKFKPNAVVVTNEAKYKEVKDALMMLPIKVFAGTDSLNEVVQWQAIDTVLGAILGFAGLSSILSAIDAGKRIALANKETLVVAGELVMHSLSARMPPPISNCTSSRVPSSTRSRCGSASSRACRAFPGSSTR